MTLTRPMREHLARRILACTNALLRGDEKTALGTFVHMELWSIAARLSGDERNVSVLGGDTGFTRRWTKGEQVWWRYERPETSESDPTFVRRCKEVIIRKEIEFLFPDAQGAEVVDVADFSLTLRS